MPAQPPIRPSLQPLVENIERVIKGKSDVVRAAVICLLARGHLLFEDVPGVGKTTLAQCLARSISCTFHRIQFTSDLLPSDIIGVTIFDPANREFQFKPGPLFANMVLADEINRTTPKTQSSLLEAMNTARVTVDKITYALPQPFIVIATQNPIEFHGTFPLPKSEMDRFLMRLSLGYPSAPDETTILREQRTLNAADDAHPSIWASASADRCRCGGRRRRGRTSRGATT
ncbi:MAG: AAA family ATPase [Candidatus Sumerlaeota bacterium]|nr:AAA family ATPase [Candidatus Sumerlaeota bacterium]